MKRCEVWWVEFDPAIGSEIKKTRPAVIVSNDSANRSLRRVQVVPLTSNMGKLYPSEAIVVLNEMPSKAMADQITTTDKQRLKSKIGQISLSDMKTIEQAIKIQLGMY